jgi:FtsP/CotA-like multicopper oxidase with cupredoxin domain
MTWLKRILIGLGIVLVLLIALVVVAGYWTPDEKSVTQTMSMTVGSRTVTVGGHYKDMTQESLADGIKVVIDGHVIVVSADQLTVDGKTQVLEPGQDVEVLVDAEGVVSVKLVSSDAGAPANAPQ